jgi:EmrB/QacA subfamily drug resistance transporter
MASTDVQERAPRGGVTHASGAHISQRQLIIIMGGIMLGVLLAALDQTVVGPAMFKIIKDLKGLEHYAWVTTAYLLTSTVTVPIFGKLGDLYGRKWFFVGGVVIFMLGSALSGLASGTGEFNFLGIAVPGLTNGMAQLIIFRGLQGIGGGMIFANAFTIIGDLVPPAERGRWQGMFGAVWGLSSVIGPTIGGYITDNISWQWVFYVNIPVGILCLLVMIFLFPHLAPSAHGSKVIDWLGAGTLVLGITPLLLALSLGGSKDFPWDSGQILTMFGLSVVFLAAFVVVEARAKEPIIPLDLFKNRIFTLSVITMFLVGVGMFGAIINIPLFIQGVQGDSATNSGNSITPMMLAVVVVSIISGQLLSRTGKYRWLGIFGMSALTVGMFLLSRMQVDTPRWETIGFMIIMGLGLGVAMPLYTLIVQNAFPPQRLGVVTSATAGRMLVLRSGISGIKAVARIARASRPEPIRNASVVAVARAGAIGCWIAAMIVWICAAGSLAACNCCWMALIVSGLISACGLMLVKNAPNCGEAFNCGLTFARYESLNWLLTTVPRMATPIVPPMERKKVVAEVTTPRRWGGKAFCTIRV